ncbi:MAG: dynamin family protein [Chloroflexi bacterium]|nr:dynamin family protein [Chloroflexota bacterium]
MRGLLGRKKVLGQRQEALLAQERELLSRLREALSGFVDTIPGDQRTLDEAIVHLDELFLLVVAGEFNSGKSSFINALIGETVLREGVTPTTDMINILKHGPEATERLREEFVLEILYPAEMLREINIVDTPGTNAVIRRHEELTRDFIPRSDLVLFVTSADRPFTESERAFLEQIREWGKKVVLVINKVDILQPAEIETVVQFVRDNAMPLLGRQPEVFPLSARLARQSKASSSSSDGAADAGWEKSRFEAIERYITDTLDEDERIRLKLLNPLGVAQSLTTKYKTAVDDRLGLLREDFITIDNIEKQIALYREDLQKEFHLHIAEIENLLHEMELRGMNFFDETVRIGRMFDLMKPDRIRAEFEDDVIGETPAQIEQRVQHVIDWLVDRQFRLWQGVNDYLNKRRVNVDRNQMLGEIGTSFDYNRAALLASVGQTARQVVSTYDREAEADELARSVQSAMTTTAIVEVGAVGLGGILVAALGSTLADFTGILASLVIASAGLYIIPNKRRQAKKDFHQKISDLRDQLTRSVTRQVNSELEASSARIREAIGPYTRFVRAQREQLSGLSEELNAIDSVLGRLRAEISNA